jgi:predicted GTPase
MIQGFEQETQPLTEYEEQLLLPVFITGLSKRIGKDLAISNAEMVDILRKKDYKISDVRVRKIINHIRTHGLVKGLIANSSGYFVATTIEEIHDYEKSLMDRENAIRAVRMSIRKQRLDMFGQPEQPKLF